ncbi:MAG: hypothetical protein AB7E19_15535 [Aeromonas sp.]|uniref:hypothetical protein n=1 Tax=Aeromonas sp. TaxID=647 RepID=UPI003D062D2E
MGFIIFYAWGCYSLDFLNSTKNKKINKIQCVTAQVCNMKQYSNCKILQKGSFISDPQRSADPPSDAAWAYGFAVISFCKNFYRCSPQAGADERGFRGADAAVGVSVARQEAVSVRRLHV